MNKDKLVIMKLKCVTGYNGCSCNVTKGNTYDCIFEYLDWYMVIDDENLPTVLLKEYFTIEKKSNKFDWLAYSDTLTNRYMEAEKELNRLSKLNNIQRFLSKNSIIEFLKSRTTKYDF